MCCEKCWGDAYFLSLCNGKPQGENYHILLKEREDNSCTAEEQAGEFWDEINKIDKRLLKKN